MSEAVSGTVIIVGAGHAAGELVTQMRDNGWRGRILMIGEETSLPYHRPPLSKAYLAGTVTAQSLLIKPQAVFDSANIEFIGGTRVSAIDRVGSRIHLADGRTAHYDRLVLATGGRPRPLSIPRLGQATPDNFHYLRTLADVDRMREQFKPGKRLVIIGGGYVGLEVASIAVESGLQVTVLEAQPRVLARVTAPELSAFYAARHQSAGVEIRTDTQVEDVQLDPSGHITAVVTVDGRYVEADLVVAGIGLVPNVELASDAGLAVDNGILVDEFGQTSDPNIHAAGDCTNHLNPFFGRRLRLESVPNALEQARCVAASICGKPKAYASVPWFWSDQFHLKLKMVGLSQGYDQLVIRGATESDCFAAFYLKDGYLLAVDTVNRAPEFMLAKRLISERIRVDPCRLADESIPVKDLLPPPP